MNASIDYQRIFDPPLRPPAGAVAAVRVGDRTSGQVYVYDEEIVLAVNVALATERPLLVRGRPGRGKSSLAPSVAHQLGRRFYRSTISSRTQARDLLWGVDEVGRLSDASAHKVRPRSHYVLPGVLWWAFDPQTAAHRGLGPTAGDSLPEPNEGDADSSGAVVLLDEIDKADPDVPNDLLEPLGSYRFRREDGAIVEAADPPPLVVLTTNEERELPKAFLRRCVVLVLRPPSAERLLEIARAHFGHRGDTMFEDVLQSFGALQDDDAGDGAGERAEEDGLDVSTAEFLDTIAAAERLRIGPGHPLWPDIVGVTARKPIDPDLR
ncbi:AAA family ATPase [Kitasatospora sp. NPDC004240]